LAKGDRELENQILPVAFEQRVRFDVDEAVSIAAWSAVRARLPFALKPNAHFVVYARRDLDFEFDFMGPESVSIASRAWVADGLATASAYRASGLNPEHARSLDDLASTLALAACFGLGAFGGPRAFAFFARRVSGQRDGLSDPFCSFLEIECDIAAQVGTATDSRSRFSAAEEIFEDRAAEHIAKGLEDVTDSPEAWSC
jgi:hypothetical protein